MMMDIQNCISNVVTLDNFRQICRKSATGRIGTGKAAHVRSTDRSLKTGHGRLLKDGATDDWHSRFALRLSQMRIGLRITEREAAAAAGCSLRTWRKYEDTGRGRCTQPVALWAMHYDVSLDVLFDLD